MKIIAIPLLAALLFYLPASSPALDRAERPEIEKGDAWTYEHTVFPSETKRNYTIRVRDVKEDAILTGGPNAGSTFSRDWALRESKRGEQVTYRAEPGRPLLQFPLEVGKRWNGNLNATQEDGQVRRWLAQGWVEKTEQVTVPAGTFQTYLIRFEGYYNWNTTASAGVVRWVESIWYAPEARRWVKRDWTWNTSGSHFVVSERQLEELVSFTRGGKPPPQSPQAQRPPE